MVEKESESAGELYMVEKESESAGELYMSARVRG